jgi:tetratricopeptide (TPR) repeat protein
MGALRSTVSKRYFVSHSSHDKPLALELKQALDGDAWVDLHEIEVGDLLLSRISAGVEAATDFVLLWSVASAASRWVEFEFNMAFARWIQDKAIAIRIIVLDETPVPLHFQPFLQGRGATDGAGVAALLRGASSETEVRHRRFFNRNVEIGGVEDALYDSSTTALWLCGMSGIGKRALARESINRITAGTNAYRIVTVSPGIAEPELHLLVASAAGIIPLPEESPLDEVRRKTSELLVNYAETGGIWVFEETDHWLEDDATLGRVAVQVLAALMSLKDHTSRLTIFTSRRRPRLDGAWKDSSVVVSLKGLSTHHSVTLLRDRGASDTEANLGTVANELDGHPLALEIIAPQLPLSASDIVSHRISIASDLIQPRSYQPNTWRLLELLSVVDGPIAVGELAENLHWTSEQMQEAIAEATSFGVIDYNDLGYIYLHPILRDYFLRSFRKDPNSASTTAELANVSKTRFEQKTTTDVDYVQSLLTTFRLLGMAGRFNEARDLRAGLIGTLFATANALYQEKRWAEALQYLDEALTGNQDLDRDALLLKAKCLAYVGKLDEARALGDALVASHHGSPKVLRDRGRIEFIGRNWDAAIVFYERALPLRKNNAQLFSDIAQALVRKEDWAAAAAAAKTAIDLKGDTAYTLNLYSQALEGQGSFAEAERMMEMAILREPRNPAYLHRAGRIAQRLGRREEALKHFRAATAIDPTQVESWLSITSFMIEMGDHSSARDTLGKVSELPGAHSQVVLNLEARIELAEGNLGAAQRLIDSALTKGRDTRNLILAIRIAIARSAGGEITHGQGQATVKLLAKELDRANHLMDIKEIWEQSPEFF